MSPAEHPAAQAPLHIGIAGPIATADLAGRLDEPSSTLPRGYVGAPLVATLIGELIDRGHRVTAFTLSSDLPLHDRAAVIARGRSLALHVLPMRPRAWPFNGHRVGRIVDLYRFERRGLERAMRAAAPDLVHAHWAYEFGWAALASGLPHLVTCHDSPLRIPRYYTRLRHSAYRWLRAGMAWHVLRQARHVTAVSPWMAGQIASLCAVPAQVVPNPIGAGVFGRRRRVVPGRCRVVMAGNGWSDFKNPAVALRAFSLVAAALPEAELLAFGADFGRGEVAERWWAAQGLRGRVTFAGAVSHAAMLDAVADADVLLHASLEESFGAVLAEAMAMAVPVVAGRHSCAVPWLVGEGGLLVDVTDPQAIAAALREILLEPALAARLGAAGRARAGAEFSAARVAGLYEQAYRAALAPADRAGIGAPSEASA